MALILTVGYIVSRSEAIVDEAIDDGSFADSLVAEEDYFVFGFWHVGFYGKHGVEGLKREMIYYYYWADWNRFYWDFRR